MEGPELETLLHRVTETPEDFLAEPRVGAKGVVHVAAVIADSLAHFDGAASLPGLLEFADADRNRLSIGLLLAWLLADPAFQEHALSQTAALQAMVQTSRELAPHVAARRLVEDPDRREELVRFTLARLALRPAGESVAQAQDRLTTISTAERQRVMLAARAAEARSRTIREELARQAAAESADKFTRE